MKKIVLIILLTAALCNAYTPPIGIVDPPSVLMDADVDNYLGQTYDFTLDGRGVQTYPVSSSGHPYTHYINSATGDDTSNPYGTEANPRATIPFEGDKDPDTAAKALAAGSIIELHGGPFVGQSKDSLYCAGTQAAPIFIRGEDGATIGTFIFYLAGYYVVIEDLNFSATRLLLDKVAATISNFGIDYCIIRNCTATGTGVDDGDLTFLDIFGGGSGATLDASYIVVYNNEISQYGDWTDTQTFPQPTPNDCCGIYIWGYSSYIWILNNTIHNNNGDSIQVGSDAARNTHHIYIGDNECYEDRENALDIKEAEDVIVSHNSFHDYYELGRDDDGICCVTHGQGSLPGLLTESPHYVWYLFNDIYNASYGLHVSHTGEYIYLIGNTFRNCPKSGYGGPTNQPALNAYLFQGGGSEYHYYINNTIENCQAGIWITCNVSDPTIYIYNNIIDTLSEGTTLPWQNSHIISDGSKNDWIDMDYNLFCQSGGSAQIYLKPTTYSLATYQATGEGLNCDEDDPVFTNQASDDLTLQITSNARGVGTSGGVVNTVYSTFQSRYGIDITEDKNGTDITAWDAGAYQYTSGVKYFFLWIP